MTDYKATPEQWHELERCSHGSQPWAPCLLELRARVELLEAISKPTPSDRQIRSSLVERVAIAISRCEDSAAWDDEAVNWAPEARAAILEVAAWLREHYGGPTASSTALEQEAER